MAQNPQMPKKKYQSDFIKMQKFHAAKDTIKKTKKTTYKRREYICKLHIKQATQNYNL
jgi:hypothetical protein